MEPTEPTPIPDIREAMRNRARPSITSWNRLEGRPRTVEFDRALRAEIRDPLWMLTRQWQVGEFQAEDAGSPVTAQYHLATTRPTHFQPKEGTVTSLPGTIPLEALAERRAVPFAAGPDPVSFDLRLTLGRRWLKLLALVPALRHLRDDYIKKYEIVLPNPDEEADIPVVAHPEVWATVQAAASRRMDGYLLYRHIRDGGHAHDGIAGVPPPHQDDLDALGLRLVAWFDDLITQPAQDGEAWDARRLEHRFSLTAPTTGGTGKLVAEEYPGGRLDWHAFCVAASTGAAADPAATGKVTRTVFPAPVRFSGMPLPRWWAFEDGRTNFAAVRPDSTDLARLVFLEFALVYSNDWFQVPCDLGTGTLATVRGLVVTDVFGGRWWVPAAGAGASDDWQRWSMYQLSNSADASLFLPPTAPKVAEGPTLEEVLLIRDENANMVWGIEHTVTLPTGDPCRGGEVAAETLVGRKRLHTPAEPVKPTAPIAYEVMRTVPENWIPFIPVHVPGDNRQVQLRRASMPRILDARPPAPPARPPLVKPRTSLLREGLDTIPPQGYHLNEEEVTRAGTRVRLAYNRTRWRGGRAVVWLSARRGTGRGEGSSGLAFDVLSSTQSGSSASNPA